MDATHKESPGLPSPEPRIDITPPDEGAPRHALAAFTCTVEDSWSAHGYIGHSWRGFVIFRLTIEADDDVDDEPGMIGATLLRQIPTGAILAAAQRSPLMSGYLASNEHAVDLVSAGPGRAPLPDELLHEVALLYIQETAPGKPRGGLKRVAERLERPQPTVSRWVTRAREQGWLAPTTRGREGAEPGPRLLSALGAGKPSGVEVPHWSELLKRRGPGIR